MESLGNALHMLVQEPSVWLCLLTAAGILVYASLRARALDRLHADAAGFAADGSATHATHGTLTTWFLQMHGYHMQQSAHAAHSGSGTAYYGSQSQAIELSAAVLFPVVSSVALILLFYFFGALSWLLQLITLFGTTIALFYLFMPYLDSAMIAARVWKPLHTWLAGALVLLTILGWVLSGHWMLNNLLGASLCVFFVSFVRLPNLKVGSALLLGLFCYDIFWVFFSKHLFGKNVMLEIATQEASNPIATMADALHLPINPVRMLPLPSKLMFPVGFRVDAAHGFVLLGLGDIVVPAIFLDLMMVVDMFGSAARRERDRDRASPASRFSTLYARGVAGYVAGVVLSFVFNVLFASPQPALLYIVPCIVVPTLLTALSRKELKSMWSMNEADASGSRPYVSIDTVSATSGSDSEAVQHIAP
ncbi:Signal peptide peptidase-like 1 [Porphyridium purpureum]|uniref:Signal peptide peptidase-like 1 n=1 Tax=Porphyridium purpureum TaxID=35688 RepID=A0A5J4YRA1_PORPP|nr:Signal peptide peptidase-like 1 [Porphyridium purpureum]|eukprot:POR9572..scf296_7